MVSALFLVLPSNVRVSEDSQATSVKHWTNSELYNDSYTFAIHINFVATNIPPVANCPADVTVFSVQGNFGGFVEFNNAVCSDSEDPAGSIIPSCDHQTGSFFQGLGNTAVTCTCTDSAGDSNKCDFNVNVQAFVLDFAIHITFSAPNIPPVANCPADVNVVSVQGNFGSVANFNNAVCSDSEDPAGSIIASCDRQTGSFFQGLGNTAVTCTCTDSAGDSNSCVFNVNVQAFVREYNLLYLGNFGSVANFNNAVCSDSEDPAGSIIAICDRQTGSFFQGLGNTAVTCTCTDSAANCPADVNVVSVQGNFGSVANFNNAVCSDSEDPAGSIIATCDRQTGSFFQGLGNTAVTCTCTDSAGDSNSCVFNVNVQAFVPPNIPPVANCPADVNVVSVQGNFGSVANFNNAVCSDSEDPAGSIIAICDRQTGSFFQGLGNTAVTCTCTDSAGDSNSCVFNVNVQAFVPPNIPPVANCPADVNVVSVQGNFGSVANFNNAVCSDSEDPAGSIIAICDRQTAPNIPPVANCPADVNVVSVQGNFGSVANFNNAVCSDSEDPAGSIILAVIIRLVVSSKDSELLQSLYLYRLGRRLQFLSPNIPPVANCPADVNVVSVQGNFGSVANFNNAVCSDSEDTAGSIIPSCDHQTGSFFQGLGNTAVNCTCTDSAGDSNSCVFNVNVQAFVPTNIPPVANCPADVTVFSVQGEFGGFVEFNNAVCSDSEDPAGSIIPSCDHQTGSFFQGPGITAINCTCTDSAGASNSCVFNVNVLAFVPTNIPPVATCPADVNVVSVQGNNGSVANFDNATCSDSEDSAGSIIATCDRQTGSFFQGLGITVVTCTCTDSTGASNSCEFNVNLFSNVITRNPVYSVNYNCDILLLDFKVRGPSYLHELETGPGPARLGTGGEGHLTSG
ncbi:putative mucin-17 isoform X3 [Apostichopus japonicus]|uniref:Putative mucin-17 isoform X3 n=1 Tax=Stichopus japonicus TaxID=307972 RepID=A0A2G8KBK6_STIJA|nr:putative mucin-17 isoform X3 [Apostichopus japonicus]